MFDKKSQYRVDCKLRSISADEVIIDFCKDHKLNRSCPFVINFLLYIVRERSNLTTPAEKEASVYFMFINASRLSEAMLGHVPKQTIHRSILSDLESIGLLVKSDVKTKDAVGYYFCVNVINEWIGDNLNMRTPKQKPFSYIPSIENRISLHNKIHDISKWSDPDEGTSGVTKGADVQIDKPYHFDMVSQNDEPRLVNLNNPYHIYTKSNKEYSRDGNGKALLENNNADEKKNKKNKKRNLKKHEVQMGERRDPVNNQKEKKGTTPKPPPSYIENNNISKREVSPMELGIMIEDTIRKHKKIERARRDLINENPELSLDSFKETFTQFLTESYTDYEHHEDGRGLIALMKAHVKHLKEYKSVPVKTESFANSRAVAYVEFMKNKGSDFQFTSHGGTFVLTPQREPIPDKMFEQEVDSITLGIQKGKIKEGHLKLLMMTVHNESDFGDYNHDYYLRKYDFTKWEDVDRYGKMMNHVAKRWIVKRGHLNDDYLAIAKSITNV